MKSRFPTLTGALLVGCLTLGLAAPAMAQDDVEPEDGAESEEHSLPTLKRRCHEAIDTRLDDLAKAQARVENVVALTPAHELAIDGIIDATQTGLTVLQNQVEAADEPQAVVRLCATVAPGYRVYLVVLPQTHLTVGADRSQAAVRAGSDVIDQLDEALERADAAGVDITEAQALRDQALVHLDAANAANDGIADAVLAVTPESFNNGAGGPVLDAARGDLRTTHAELQASSADAKAAAAALQDALSAVA
ncbi:MAG: hypothetical protein DHS20C19_18690 [Acidimicrobiales bacterium]|nr:MAG: hypothetical protein DHS20C19_18690 [Acidimicrobiales bacterium]